MSILHSIVIALDCRQADSARALVDQLGDRIERYKVGPQLFNQTGPEFVKWLQGRGKKVMLDLKLHDTPQVVARSVEQFTEMGVEFATVHCMGGASMLHAASSACRGSTLRLLGVTVLTSQGLPDSDADTVFDLATLAMESRLAGVLCSPHEAGALRARTVPGFLLVTPGIRFEDSPVFQDDQVRTASPQQALSLGADLLIVGRPITQSREPLRVLAQQFGL